MEKRWSVKNLKHFRLSVTPSLLRLSFSINFAKKLERRENEDEAKEKFSKGTIIKQITCLKFWQDES